MTLEKLNILSVGITAVVVGAVVLLAMIRFDLAPAGKLTRSGQWLLATALGTGIVAFAFKLLLIVAMVQLPHVLIEPLIAGDEPPKTARHEDPLVNAFNSPRYVWLALPESAAAPTSPQSHLWQPLPSQAPAPTNNPTTPEKIALGERLFFDRNLSWDRKSSCSSCHDVKGATGTDGRATSIGIHGQVGKRNAPTVWNAAFQSVLFWDGRAASLEDQAKGPLVNPVEMGMPSLQAVEERVKEEASYREPFARAFGAGAPITIERIAQAIAAYERTLITPDAPYDRFVRGELKVLTQSQLRGMALFQSLGCIQCHSGPNFSAASLFDGRAPQRLFPTFPTPYEEQYGLTRDAGAAAPGSGRGLWRVPSLRNVALTAPYFHNGSVTELKEAVRIMANTQLGRTGRLLIWSDRNKSLTEMNNPRVTEAEVSDVVAFLCTLTSEQLVAKLKKNAANSNAAVRYAANCL